MTDSKPPLHGLTVVDLSRVLAGPYCTMMLGDLGADVIKIEMPGRGDDTRHWGPPFTDSGISAYYLSANRNKRSLTLDLKNEAGLEVLKRLIQRADVLVDNFKVGTLESFGLADEALRQLKPDLIYCTVTGYGYDGPYRERPGYDFIVQALGGFMSVTGPGDGEPVRAGVAIADLAAGIFAASSILAALYRRQQTGMGERIDISLLDSMVAMMSYVASNYLVSGDPPARYGNGHPNIVPYQAFKASDRYFALAIGNDGQWRRLCAAAKRESWAEDARFATNAKRVENREPLTEMLEELFAQQPADHWIELCLQAGIASAPINSLDRVFENPQVAARQLQRMVTASDGEALPTIASPLRLQQAAPVYDRAPPALGEHTDEILLEIGYTDRQIAVLRDEGAL